MKIFVLGATLALPMAFVAEAQTLRSTVVPADAMVVIPPRGQPAPPLVAASLGAAPAPTALPPIATALPMAAAPLPLAAIPGALLPLAAAALLGGGLPGGGGGGSSAPATTR
ncbi:MAG TPA: hypothetical protein VGN83_25325 [Falsiroseomonas sp.]|jgi:hypothetical protein|nr:hypothetical protein [Falsiroseomonas sp.]